jgi:auxin efflux carrier (AEC)
MSSPFLDTFIPLVLMIFVGYITKRIGVLKSEDVKPFNNVVIKIALPCLVFISLYDADLSNMFQMIGLTGAGLIAGLITTLITFLILTYKKIGLTEKWSLILPVTMGQTAFLGYPIVLGIWGKPGLVLAVFYDISTYIIFAILILILTIQFKNGFSKKDVIDVVKKVIYLPILWGIALGIIFNLVSFIYLPSFITNTIHNFANATVPLVMILLGLSLEFEGLRENYKVATGISILQLVVFPTIVAVCVYLMGFQNMSLKVPVVEAAMPCAILALALSIDHDLDYKLTSDCIIISTILSLITIPILLSFIGG